MRFQEMGSKVWRYDTAYTMLSQTNTYTSEYARDVLDAVKLDMVTTFTLTSTVADLKKRETTIFYLSQFNEGVTLSIDDELIKGQRILPLEDFFSSSTVEAGKTAYRKFKIRFRAAQSRFLFFWSDAICFLFFSSFESEFVDTSHKPLNTLRIKRLRIQEKHRPVSTGRFS